MNAPDVKTARPPYKEPAGNWRPFGTHRFDVYSAKAGRRLTLFGRESLALWLELETDPAVTQLCERPLVVPDERSRRVVDFWAAGEGFDRLIFVVPDDDAIAATRRRERMAAFLEWAADVRCAVEEHVARPLDATRQHWIDNWTHMLQCIDGDRAELVGNGAKDVAALLTARTTIGELARRISAERGARSEVAYAAIFSLVRSGQARILGLEERRLSDEHEIEPAS
jgi:hypothetical protein